MVLIKNVLELISALNFACGIVTLVIRHTHRPLGDHMSSVWSIVNLHLCSIQCASDVLRITLHSVISYMHVKVFTLDAHTII